jgi:plastocyanin
MRRARLAAAVATGAAALAAPAAAQADQAVSMPGRYFSPARVTVLTGERVTWRNDDAIRHDVSAAGLFNSGPLEPTASQSFAFDAPGTYAYRCTIHAFMAGAVTVAPVTLETPAGAVLAGQAVRLTGRAPAGTARVALERSLDGTTWADAGVGAVPGADGAFFALVPAAEGAVFRAVVPGGASSVVAPQVAARVPVSLKVARGHHHASVLVRTAPAGAGLVATLETYRRERFVWRRYGKAVKLDKRGRAAFHVPAALRARARLVLAARAGGPALITSRPVRLRDGRPTRSPIPVGPLPAAGHDGDGAHGPGAAPGGEHGGHGGHGGHAAA